MAGLKQRKWWCTFDGGDDGQGTRPGDGYAITKGGSAVVLGWSSGDLPSRSGSASETVVVDRVDVFLDLDAVYLCDVRGGKG